MTVLQFIVDKVYYYYEEICLFGYIGKMQKVYERFCYKSGEYLELQP